MNQHTPGPWKINHWTQNDGGVKCIGEKNDITHFSAPLVFEDCFQIVADIKPLDHPLQADHQGAHICKIVDFKSQDAGVMAEANARLISASPDLLAVLQEIIDWGGSHGTGVDVPLYNKAVLAVNKATGQ